MKEKVADSESETRLRKRKQRRGTKSVVKANGKEGKRMKEGPRWAKPRQEKARTGTGKRADVEANLQCHSITSLCRRAISPAAQSLVARTDWPWAKRLRSEATALLKPEGRTDLASRAP